VKNYNERVDLVLKDQGKEGGGERYSAKESLGMGGQGKWGDQGARGKKDRVETMETKKDSSRKGGRICHKRPHLRGGKP